MEVEKNKISNNKERYKKEREYYKNATRFKFRHGNVPCVSKYKHHKGDFSQRMCMSGIRKENADIEHKEFIRPCERMSSIPYWDYRPRHLDRSWKTSYKCKKQWMKNMHKHVDTYQIKSTFNIEEEFEDVA